MKEIHINGKTITLKKVIKFVSKKISYIPNKLLEIFDSIIPKRNDYWIFPVYFIGRGNFTDNSLAIFEQVKNDINIKKIILTREVKIDINGENIVIIPMHSYMAVWYLMRANIIFVQHSIWLDLSKAKYQIINPLKRNIINLWHGIPIKDISHENTGIINKRSLKEMPNYKVLSSSEIDMKNMQKAFYLTDKKNFWITGIPRNDFLIIEDSALPHIYQQELKHLKSLLNGKNLILYAPTYRETNVNGSYYDFTDEELDLLEDFLIKHNAILGLRYHIYRKPNCYKTLLKRENIIDLSSEVISDVRLIIRESKIVITDYSSLYVDALYINKKCISFAYDYEHYLKTQRGFFYNFELIFPGKVCLDFNALMVALHNGFKLNTEEELKKIKKIQSILFQYIDTNNSKRVVDKIKVLI